MIRHYILRFWLARANCLPWQVVGFLEDATKRILLQRVGRGYHFTHQLLLDYFADLDTTVPSTSSGNQLPPQPSSPETA